MAEVAGEIFGPQVKPEHIIGETLKCTTPPDTDLAALKAALTNRAELIPPQTYAEFILHPFSIWIEDTFGLEERDGRLVRQQPRSIKSAAEDLHEKTGVERETCAEYI